MDFVREYIGIKEKQMKIHAKTIVFIAILLLSTTTSNAQNQTITVKGTQIQVSPVVQKVLKQAETVYVNPSRFTIDNFYNDAPDVIPTFLGLIMHRQEILMDEIKNVEHLNNSSAIEKEIMAFLEQLAQAHNYRDPADNTSMPTARLNISYLEAVRGDQNANFKNNMGIDPTKVNIAYLLDRSPNRNKDVPQLTKESITNPYPGSGNTTVADTNRNRSPSLKITDLYYEPNPLPVNTAFDVICRFKPDIPQMGNNTIPVIFYFKVYRGSKVLFTSKHYTVNARNNKVEKWVQHMNAISKKGTYKCKAFVKYKNISDNQSINIKIE